MLHDFEPMLSEIPDDEFSAALDACASEALWEAGFTAPPVDALADLVTNSGGRTDITKVNVLWRRTLGGDAVALFAGPMITILMP